MHAIQNNVAFGDTNDKTDMTISFCPLSIAAIVAQDDEKCSDSGIAAVAQDADANGDWDPLLPPAGLWQLHPGKLLHAFR